MAKIKLEVLPSSGCGIGVIIIYKNGRQYLKVTQRSDPAYHSEVIEQLRSRMLARSVYLTLFLSVGSRFGALSASLGDHHLIPYRT